MVSQHNIHVCKYRISRALESIEAADSLMNTEHAKKSVDASYKGVFHSIRALLILNNIKCKKHIECIYEFNKLYKETGVFKYDLGAKAYELHVLADKANYANFFEVSKDEALEAYNTALNIQNSIVKYINDTYPEINS